ncbi:MAG TPA: HAMP domain-containing sensor histidine kinase [Ktedonobacteraceae bacterium]|nr:HAMP domain-containing sensor histidine kinase [Ktedonobacteraceae bacterium]
MYIPLQLRLSVFYALLLGLTLWFFGNAVYTQAQQRAYSDLDTALSSRAASVYLGKNLLNAQNMSPGTLPLYLNSSINGLGAGDIAIEVLDSHLRLLATTTYNSTSNFLQPGVTGYETSPVPWDARAARQSAQSPYTFDGPDYSLYSTVTYQGQPVRVYTTFNPQTGDIIQTAQSEAAIQQSLDNLRILLWQGGVLVMILALAGGWFITWSVLATVRRMTKTARRISASQDFGQRVPEKSALGKNELTRLATTFNGMLAELQEAYQHQQRFVADASHELRAPITSIRCNLDLLAKAPDLAPGESAAALSDARAEADRMGRLVNDLLTLARADSMVQEPEHKSSGYKKIYVSRQQVDLDSLMLEVYRQYRVLDQHDLETAKAQGPRIILQDITPAQVYGDADKLKQSLVALLENALKYTPYEGTVTLSLTTRDENALISVCDTGIGILPEDLPHIFERFYRADPARSRDRGGSGLGLAIVKSIVEEHGGSISVESTPGKGSVFNIKMPLIS